MCRCKDYTPLSSLVSEVFIVPLSSPSAVQMGTRKLFKLANKKKGGAGERLLSMDTRSKHLSPQNYAHGFNVLVDLTAMESMQFASFNKHSFSLLNPVVCDEPPGLYQLTSLNRRWCGASFRCVVTSWKKIQNQ